MKECTKGLIDFIFDEILKAPATQIDEEACKMLKECKDTYPEKYDTIVKISKMDVSKVSEFVKELCALDKCYARPTED